VVGQCTDTEGHEDTVVEVHLVADTEYRADTAVEVHLDGIVVVVPVHILAEGTAEDLLLAGKADPDCTEASPVGMEAVHFVGTEALLDSTGNHQVGNEDHPVDDEVRPDGMDVL